MDIHEIDTEQWKGFSGAKRRYRENLQREQEIRQIQDSCQHINGQERFPVGDMRFGHTRACGTACEAIAVYNVLQDLAVPCTLSEVIFLDEALRCISAFGYFGTKIRKIGKLLKHYGVDFQKISPREFVRRGKNGDFEDGQMFIVTIRNDGRYPICSLHTFEVIYRGGRFTVYNRFNNSRSGLIYTNLEDVLYNGPVRGSYYSIYMITQNNQKKEGENK